MKKVTKRKVTYKDVWDFTWHYWSRDKAKMVIVFITMGIAAATDSVFPLVTGKLIDAIHSYDLGATQLWDAVWPYFILLTVVGFSYHSLRNGALFIWNRFAVRNLYEIENEAFQKVQKFSSDWHANTFAGATVRKISRAKWAFDQFADIIFMNVFPAFIIMIAVLSYTTMKSPWLGLATFVSGGLYLWLNAYMVLRINRPKFEISAKRDTTLNAQLADIITGNTVVKAFGTEHREERRFQNYLRRWRLRALHSWNAFVMTDMIRRYMSETMAAMMVGTAILLWSHGALTPGDVVFSLTSFMLLSHYLRALGDNMAHLQKAISDMEDTILFWKRKDEMEDAPDAKPITVTKGEIVFDHVVFTYRNKRENLFNNMNVIIRPGEKVALVGQSGSGKSSFIKLIQRLYDIDGGQVRIDGQNVAEVTQSSLRQHIALVPQEPILFHRSIAANIAYARPSASMEDIREAARLAYADNFIETLPQGYDTLVGERGIKLSGGERQRIAIARAILADAPILILDEATSSLDSLSEHYIQKALENLMEGRTTVTIAHRLSTIQNADRILVFSKGKIVEEGTHAELIAKEDSGYKELYDMQAMELVGEVAQ